MSLLTIVKSVALRCNYPQPSAAYASTDPNVQLMIACAQDTGDEMVERINWQANKISTPATFSGDGTTTLFSLPSNFQALSPSDTFTSSLYPTLRMLGPVNEDDLLRMKALPITTLPSVWRQVDNQIEFFPALAGFTFTGNTTNGSANLTNVNVDPTVCIGNGVTDANGKVQASTTISSVSGTSAPYTVVLSKTCTATTTGDIFTSSPGEVVSYVYAGDSWINTSGGTPIVPALWAADTNVAAISERTIMLGAVWRWKRAKGFDYSEEFTAYEHSLAAQAGQESTQRVIPTSNSFVDWDIAFPGTITDNTDQTY